MGSAVSSGYNSVKSGAKKLNPFGGKSNDEAEATPGKKEHYGSSGLGRGGHTTGLGQQHGLGSFNSQWNSSGASAHNAGGVIHRSEPTQSHNYGARSASAVGGSADLWENQGQIQNQQRGLGGFNSQGNGGRAYTPNVGGKVHRSEPAQSHNYGTRSASAAGGSADLWENQGQIQNQQRGLGGFNSQGNGDRACTHNAGGEVHRSEPTQSHIYGTRSASVAGGPANSWQYQKHNQGQQHGMRGYNDQGSADRVHTRNAGVVVHRSEPAQSHIYGTKSASSANDSTDSWQDQTEIQEQLWTTYSSKKKNKKH